VLETPRLALRHLETRDAGFMLALLNDPAWLRYIGDRGVRDVEGARGYLEERIIAMYARFGFGLWMVESRGEGRPMGICGLVKRDSLEDIDLGFAFMPEFRGKGIAYESALAARDHAVGALGLKRLLAITSPMNADSIRLLARLGFAFEREMSWAGDAKDVVSVYAYSP
jgi:RimJ/RimL family protein N-acetyltransferase